jgi:TorA maturation chaperone TorD
VGSLSEAHDAIDRRPEARSRAYALFSIALGRPEHVLELTRAAPALRAAVDRYADRDELLADHEHAFGFSCPPFESAFLDPGAVLGHETSDRVRAAVASAGVERGPSGEEPDHLATILSALGRLCGAEADALEDGRAPIVARLRGLERRLLDEHLLRWLPIFACAVERTDRAWPVALVRSIVGVVLEHRSSLGAGSASAFALGGAPLVLEEHVGLAEIATYLTVPACSGAFFSRDDLARLGRSARAPRGFGERSVLTENLLRSAADLDVLGELVDRMHADLEALAAELAGERFSDVPIALREPWIDRIAHTRALLERLR